MVIYLEMIAGWVVTIGTIGAPLMYIIRLSRKLLDRISKLEGWTKSQQQDIDSTKEERKILLCGMLACLKGLKQQGCNGPVNDAIREIEAFLIREACRGESRKAG